MYRSILIIYIYSILLHIKLIFISIPIMFRIADKQNEPPTETPAAS